MKPEADSRPGSDPPISEMKLGPGEVKSLAQDPMVNESLNL